MTLGLWIARRFLLTSSSSLLLLRVLSQFHPLICNSESLRGKMCLWTSPLSQQVFVEPELCIRSCSEWRGALTSLVNEIQSAQRVTAFWEPDVEEIIWLNGPFRRRMMRTCCLNQSHWWSMARQGQSLSAHNLHLWLHEVRPVTLLEPFKHIYVCLKNQEMCCRLCYPYAMMNHFLQKNDQQNDPRNISCQGV